MLNVATISAPAAFRSTGIDAGEISHPCGAASLSSPFTGPGRRGDVHCNRSSIRSSGTRSTLVRHVRENWRRNDQRPGHFTRDASSAVRYLCVHDVPQFLSADLQNYLDRKSRGILGQTDKLLIVDSEGAERLGFSKPVTAANTERRLESCTTDLS